jgi:hypothetical protein
VEFLLHFFRGHFFSTNFTDDKTVLLGSLSQSKSGEIRAAPLLGSKMIFELPLTRGLKSINSLKDYGKRDAGSH